MYVEHPAFLPPADPEAKIWRYQDFSKLLWTLQRRALFFARADSLGDPFEGSYPKCYSEQLEALRKSEGGSASKARRWYCVNCWHMAEYESAAMWRLYSHGSNGVALQSSYTRLVETFAEADHDVYVGRVRYIDYDRDRFPDDDPHHPMMHKRRAFEHEREIRAVVKESPRESSKTREKNGAADTPDREHDRPGIIVSANTDKLIERIYVNPASPSWQVEMIRGTVEKFGIDPDMVSQSELAEPPYLPD
jgi:hypothetical protein